MEIPVIGWFGAGPHPDAGRFEDQNSGGLPNLLGYSVGFCHRFGGAIQAIAVNPRTGTVYVADNARYRVLIFQPEFQFRKSPLVVTIGTKVLAITGTGGLAPLTFAIKDGQLPKGLRLDSKTGLIAGTPSGKSSEYAVTIRVKTAIQDVGSTVRIRVRESR